MAATSHMWVVSIWIIVTAAEKLDFNLFLISLALSLSSPSG